MADFQLAEFLNKPIHNQQLKLDHRNILLHHLKY